MVSDYAIKITHGSPTGDTFAVPVVFVRQSKAVVKVLKTVASLLKQLSSFNLTN